MEIRQRIQTIAGNIWSLFLRSSWRKDKRSATLHGNNRFLVGDERPAWQPLKWEFSCGAMRWCPHRKNHKQLDYMDMSRTHWWTVHLKICFIRLLCSCGQGFKTSICERERPPCHVLNGGPLCQCDWQLFHVLVSQSMTKRSHMCGGLGPVNSLFVPCTDIAQCVSVGLSHLDKPATSILWTLASKK